MSWPLASHFSAMLQNPRVAFRDPVLKMCRVEKDQRNQPRPWSGAFAVVYKAYAPDSGRPFAVRCFTTESPERRERYDQISAYLNTRRLNCLVDFEYRDRSIRSAGDGKWYPLILMDWVQGETLFKWCRATALAGNREALAAAAERWLALVKELADSQISHGDLQHANVMVTPQGELKLVDYDCMCVPALVGRRNLEVGVEPYQHPERSATTHLSLDLDNFSAMVIYVALRALAADPSLWQKYVEGPAHDKLLFRIEDFQLPGSSPLCRDLAGSPAQDVRDLAGQLFQLWRCPMDQVPPLAQATNSYATIEQLLHGGRWEAAVKQLNRRGQFRDAPAELKPLIHQAYEYVCKKQAWAPVAQMPHEATELNDRKLVNAWNEDLFRGFEPAERERARVEAARARVAALDRLHYAVQQTSEATNLAREEAILQAAGHLPADYRYSLEPRVRRAEGIVDAVRKLERVVRESNDDARVARAWRRVRKARCEKLVPKELRRRIARSEKRRKLLDALARLSGDMPADELDRRLLELWDEELLAGHDEAERWRNAYEWAVFRRDLLDRIGQAIGRGDDVEVVELAADPGLEGYTLPSGWPDAIEAARRNADTFRALEMALEMRAPAAFVDSFDARVLRRYADKFEPHREAIEAWTALELLDPGAMGLGPAAGRASVELIDKSEHLYRVRWSWPGDRFADECILAVAEELPEAADDPREVEAPFRETVPRADWDNAGQSVEFRAEPEWTGHHVAVWAVIDLGFRQWFSHPVVLGTLGKRPKEKRGRAWSVLAGFRGGRPRADGRPRLPDPAQSLQPREEEGDGG